VLHKIPLSHGKFAIVDEEDFARVSAFEWRAVRARQTNDNWYAKRTESKDGATLNVYMHRFILGVPGGVEVDHADRDGLNNTRENLRECSRSLNCANKQLERPASGYRGVSFVKGKWQARVTVDGRVRSLGVYLSAEEAARVRDAFVSQLYGEFAVLNFSILTRENAA